MYSIRPAILSFKQNPKIILELTTNYLWTSVWLKIFCKEHLSEDLLSIKVDQNYRNLE